MKKITLLLLTLFFSFSGYSQLALEGFEATTGPEASPSTNWTLGTGNWLVFDNGVPGANRWGISTSTTPPTQVHAGDNAAYMMRETTFPGGQTVEDYLATPVFEVPTNGQLRFWTRGFLLGNQGTVYQVKIAPEIADPTDPNSYLLVQQWTDADLVTTISQYQEKIVDLSAYVGANVRIAFVMQQAPITAPFGDRWFLDDVQVVTQCFAPTALTVTPSITSASLSWLNPGGTSWEVELIPAAATPTGTGTVYNGTLPYVVTTTLPAGVPLTGTTPYKYYVRAICTGGVTSAWVGPLNFTTSSPGLSCAAPITVTTLPYSTTSNTGNFSDTTDVAQPAGCVPGGVNYMAGNEVFYSYTAPANGTISVSMTPTAGNSSLFVYNGCTNVAVACLGGVANATTAIRTLPNIPVVAGQQYIIVISSSAATQTVGYSLIIQNVNCANPANLNATGISQTGATLSWAPGGSTSWQVVVQEAGLGVPAGAGATTATSSYVVPNPLLANTNYEFYVRADCNNGTFSAWSGPFVFRTLCTAFTVPFQEGFNSTSTTEGCWTVLNVNGDTDAWDMNYTPTPFEGNQAAMLYTDGNAGANNDWLISPQVLLTGNQRLRYRYRVQSAGEPNDFRVMLSINGTSPADFTTTLLPLTSYNNIVYQEAIINLSAYTGAVNIGWHVPAGGLDGWRLYIDNVIIENLPTCPEPSLLTSTAVLSTTATLNWTNGGTESQWQVIAVPCGSPAPAAGATGFVVANTRPFTLLNLLPTTCYDVYIRAVCAGNDLSPWTGPTTFTTQAAPPVCGGNYVDAGGVNGPYAGNSNETITICPTTPGDLVTVTFTSFNTENSFDGMYVYDGNSVGAPQIPSANGAGFGQLTTAGAFWGTANPGPFTSTSADGCLTFNFRSDGSVNNAGWIANITCAPAPTCRKPTAIVTSAVTSNAATVAWTQPVNPDNSVASQWQILALPCAAPPPTATTTGFTTVNTNPYTLTGLNSDTCYTIYIRAVCSTTDVSLWGVATSITTQITPPACGGQFTDTGGATGNYAGGANVTTTICPTNPNEVVTVTFTSFNTENSFDGLYVYDGNSTTAPIIPSGNAAGFGQVNIPGAFWGNLNGALPGPFTSTSNDGCLTFNFRSDGSVNYEGWVASITCSPAPNCVKPIMLTSTEITANSALLGWTETNPAVTQWEVIILPFGSPVPLPTAIGTIVSINPALFSGLDPGTRYTFYVRAICPIGGTSAWSSAQTFATLVINDNCSGAIFAPVNSSSVCQQVTAGTVSGATPSLPAIQAPCVGTADDDVWFQFIASNSYLNIALQDVTGASTNLNFAVYSGQCANLTQIFCSTANTLTGVANNLVIGQTYFIRVYSNANTPQAIDFNLCISTPSTCLTGSTVCSLTDYGNTTGVTSLGTIGCLFSSPNPAFFAVEVATSGPINFTLTQSTFPSVNGVPGTPNLDVDYAAWGPFANQAVACAFIGAQQPFATPGIGVPVTQQAGCSYSAAPTETLNIANAQAGQVYIILITNYSNQAGYINLTQNNASNSSAGTTNCCPDAYFSYNPSSFCITPGATNPLPIIQAGSISGTFSSTIVPGLVFVDSGTSVGSLTGQIDLANSLPGNYVITNTTLVTATCSTSKVKYFTVNLVLPTNATIAYGAASYCKSVTGNQLVTQTGATGGNYAVSPNGGLYINTTTGSFNPSLSAPGIYTITYNIPGNGVCVNSNPSAQVEIKAQPVVVSPGNQIVCGSYELLPITVGNYYTAANGGGTMLNAGDLITSTQNIYIFANVNGCTDEKMFNVNVNTDLVVDVIADFGTCGTYNLLPLTVGNYYTGPGGTGTMLNAGDPISATTTLYIYAASGLCTDESSFTITIGGLSITAPASGAYCNSYVLPIPTLGDYYTGPGGTGTMFTLPATITATQTIYLYENENGCMGEDSFTVTINTIATPTVTVTQPTCATPSGTIVVTSPIGSTTGTPPSDLFISEVTDAQTGSLSYIEIYNGTGVTKNLADYKIAVYNNGNPTFSTNCDMTLSGILNNDSVFVLAIGSSTNLGGVTPNMVVANCGAINTNDNIRLVSSTDVLIDTWGRNDGVDFTPNNQPGYTYRRLPTATVPKTTWDSADWTALNPEDYSNVGSYTFTPTVASSYEYNIDGGTYQGDVTFTGVAPGTHIVTAQDVVTGCISEPLEVVINAVPLASSVTGFSYNTPVCQIGLTNPVPATDPGFTTGGTYSYIGTGLDLNTTTGEITLANTTAGVYEVTYAVLEDLTNCTAASSTTFEITINAPAAAMVDFTYSTPVCQIGLINPMPIPASGFITGGTYSYVGTGLDLNTSTGEIILANSTAGMYTVTYAVLEDNANCIAAGTSTFEITINAPAAPIVGFSYTSPVCQIGTTNPMPIPAAGFVAGGTYSYAGTGLDLNASTGEIILANSTAGTYQVVYTVLADATTCQAGGTSLPAEIVINAATNPVINFSYTSPVCQSGVNPMPITVTVPLGGTYSYTGTGLDLNATTGEINLSNSTAGTYEIVYSVNQNVAQCQNAFTSAPVTIVINAAIASTFNALTPICSGETAPSLPTNSIEGTPGTWNPATISNTASGTYTFTPDAGQCASSGSLSFVVNPNVVATFTDVSICEGESLSFPATSIEGNLGTWSPATVSLTQSGSYTFTPNSGQCAANGVWNVTVLPSFDFEISGSCVATDYTLAVASLNNSVDLSTASFTWMNAALQMVGNNQSTFNVSQYLNSTPTIEQLPITFSVTITNTDGCTTTESFVVDNIACTIQKGISADGDGLNDNFDLLGFDVKKLTIFNRYGMKVYSKTNYTNQWMGQTDKGDELPDATYYYVIEFNTSSESKTGWIYLNRAQ